MDISEAMTLVVADQRESGDCHSPEDAIAHALNTLSLPEDLPAAGASAVEGDDELADAYKVVLRARHAGESPHDAAARLVAAAGDGFTFALGHPEAKS